MKCSICKSDKNDNEFSFKCKAKNIRSHTCKECHKTYAKKHYTTNKPTYIARAKLSSPKYRERNRRLVAKYLSDKKCIDCGESNICTLDFDHRDPSEKELAIANMISSYSWDHILDEINKCDIRCANCHRKRTAKQFGTYKALFG